MSQNPTNTSALIQSQVEVKEINKEVNWIMIFCQQKYAECVFEGGDHLNDCDFKFERCLHGIRRMKEIVKENPQED